MAKPAQERYELDPDDGLIREIVGEWSPEKHLRLRRYVDITSATRRKFLGNEPAYVDLYCGTGRARIKETDQVVDGSALVAARQGIESVPFRKTIIADCETTFVRTCAARLEAAAIQNVETLIGSAEDTVDEVVQRLNPYALHLALLDPFSLGSLPMTVIERLAQLKRMDFIIHFSWMDLQRNLSVMAKNGTLERVAPGWQSHVDLARTPGIARGSFFAYWRSRLEEFGFFVSDSIERISGPQNQPLYLLLLASRNKLADRFWSQVSKVDGQGRLF